MQVVFIRKTLLFQFDMAAVYMCELAQAYFPKSTPRSASAQLHRWIELNHDLKRRLRELHFQPRQRALTPLQYEAIIKYLGDPGG